MLTNYPHLVSDGGNAIGHVRLSTLYFFNQLTFDLDFLRVYDYGS